MERFQRNQQTFFRQVRLLDSSNVIQFVLRKGFKETLNRISEESGLALSKFMKAKLVSLDPRLFTFWKLTPFNP